MLESLLPLLTQCAPTVHPETMARVISVESAAKAWAIGYKITKGGIEYRLTSQPANTKEAQSWATWLLTNGYRFDAGITQVNSNNFKQFGLTPENVFDPCANINAGSKILTNFYSLAVKKFGPGENALRAAISAYQSGNFVTGFATGYVGKVINKELPKTFYKTTPILQTVGMVPEEQQNVTITIENY